jgi:FixJ family two-component response regulator
LTRGAESEMWPKIYFFDDEDSVRRDMKRLIPSTGMDVHAFASSQEPLEYKFRNHNACMIVDIK